jgi:hypothetical protein
MEAAITLTPSLATNASNLNWTHDITPDAKESVRLMLNQSVHADHT